MSEWRYLRSWSEAELAERLRALDVLERNFDTDETAMVPAHGWHGYASEALLTHEKRGLPVEDGFFERGWLAMLSFKFSDPAIVVAHFDPDVPLLGRRMLLEVKVLGLRYLNGTVVSAVRTDRTDTCTTYGFRYDTLEGHIEAGTEWFLLTKDHGSGDVRFTIRAKWRAGEFPNWWSRVGFHVLGRHYQRRWHVHAHHRLLALMREPKAALRLRRGRLAHEGPDVAFTYEPGIRR